MSNWYSNIYMAFIVASLIAFVIGAFTQSMTSLGAYIAGYSVLTLGIMMVLILLFNNVLRVTQNSSTTETLAIMFATAGPFIMLFGIISFMLYLLINYKNNIVDDRVAPGYSTFSNIIMALTLVQVLILCGNLRSDQFKQTGTINRVTSGLIYLFGTITLICSIILYTILKYYSTDGFRTVIRV